jgi:hypothetical protein
MVVENLAGPDLGLCSFVAAMLQLQLLLLLLLRLLLSFLFPWIPLASSSPLAKAFPSSFRPTSSRSSTLTPGPFTLAPSTCKSPHPSYDLGSLSLSLVLSFPVHVKDLCSARAIAKLDRAHLFCWRSAHTFSYMPIFRLAWLWE